MHLLSFKYVLNGYSVPGMWERNNGQILVLSFTGLYLGAIITLSKCPKMTFPPHPGGTFRVETSVSGCPGV